MCVGGAAWPDATRLEVVAVAMLLTPAARLAFRKPGVSA